MILSQRPNDDDSKSGFTRWPFMTTHTWAEMPRGEWTLDIMLVPGKNNADDTGVFREWTLMLHGMKESPYQHQKADDSRHLKLASVKRMHASVMKE